MEVNFQKHLEIRTKGERGECQFRLGFINDWREIGVQSIERLGHARLLPVIRDSAEERDE